MISRLEIKLNGSSMLQEAGAQITIPTEGFHQEFHRAHEKCTIRSRKAEVVTSGKGYRT
jgi:hypothetical protein